jgi:hypothetical protein
MLKNVYLPIIYLEYIRRQLFCYGYNTINILKRLKHCYFRNLECGTCDFLHIYVRVLPTQRAVLKLVYCMQHEIFNMFRLKITD